MGESSRVTEGSSPRGRQAGRGFSELKGRGGAESARGRVDVKFREIGRRKIVKGLKGEEKNFEVNVVFKEELLEEKKQKNGGYGESLVMIQAAEVRSCCLWRGLWGRPNRMELQ